MTVLRLAVIVACVLAARPAFAQKAEATVAFQRGQQLKRDGKIAEACAAFELSMKLDAQSGTQYNLALCYQDLGRTASAWAELDALSNTDRNEKRRADAQRRAQDLKLRLVRVRLKLTQPVASLGLSRDGIDVTALVDTPTPVDPGKHRFAARAPGYREWSTEVEIAGEGKTIDVVVPALATIAVAAAPIAPSPAVATVASPLPPEPRDEVSRRPGRNRRITGVALLSVGVVSLAVGSVYGVRALSKGDEVRDACGGDTSACTDMNRANQLLAKGRDFATISDVGLIAGGALAVAGAVLYVTAPRGVTAAPLVGSGTTAGIIVSARF